MRVLEIVRRITGHANLFHDAPRAPVRRNRERNDFRELQFVEPESEDGPRAFRGQPLSPKLRAQSPADLDAWSEGRLKGRVDHADEADEPASVAEFGGEEGEAVLRLMGSMRAMRASDSSRESGAGKYCITRGSEVMRWNGSRSWSRQSRRRRRGVSIIGPA
jgi:hypothetical protein